ncbi:HAD hydrolase-like protein [Streptomyces sp. NPDC046237]|uniref:HAD family hydrolase n=1 Tax=Streptomyces sp. NPDC046237 TaxID=3154914 RepID=UPI0033C1103D
MPSAFNASWSFTEPQPVPARDSGPADAHDVTNCTLIGDSLTDIQAAHAAGTTVVGYANKPHRADLFAEAKADTIADGMGRRIVIVSRPGTRESPSGSWAVGADCP